MFKRFRVEWILVVGLTVAITVSPGCALFGGSGGPENAGFHRTATTSTNPVPLPVEIVSDISMIASGYGNPQDGVWKPVYPEVERKPATPETQNSTTGQITAPSNSPVVESDTATMPTVGETAQADSKSSTAMPVSSRTRSGKTEEYKVRSGDTLMKISFEKFGNIYRWREIYNRNRERISNFNRLTAGTVLVIEGVEYVVITRNGLPYLIRRGDTLGKISGKVYGVNTKWRAIWRNNPELIKDPNKIYAGFTLYYVPTDGKPLAKPVKQVTEQKPVPANVFPEKAPASVDEPTAVPVSSPPAPENSWVPAQ